MRSDFPHSSMLFRSVSLVMCKIYPSHSGSYGSNLISLVVPYEAVRSVPLPPQGGVGIGMLPGNAGSSSRPHHNHVDALNA